MRSPANLDQKSAFQFSALRILKKLARISTTSDPYCLSKVSNSLIPLFVLAAYQNQLPSPSSESESSPALRESIDGRRLKGAGYLIEVVGL